jgi:hypothetical protein
MAITACQECDHKVSDQAASCPGCGAPIAGGAVLLKRGQRASIVAVLAFAALALLGKEIWLRTAHPWGRAGASADIASPRLESSGRNAPSSAAFARGEPSASAQTVYQTSAVQLYQDYLANGVATQSKIADSRVRITGTISAIDEDASGDPVVKLAASADHSVNTTLGQEEIAAAAQLARGQMVDIECDSMRRIMGSPEGSHCRLAVVQGAVPTTTVAVREILPPAPTSAPDRTSAPDSEARLPLHVEASSPHREAAAVVASTGRKSRKSVPSSLIAMVPAAARLSFDGAAASAALPAAETTDITPLPEPQFRPVAAANASAAPVQDAVPPVSASAPSAPPPSAPPPPLDASAPPAAAPATIATVLSTTRASDDLEMVRAADPQAADHIASYCATTSPDGGSGAASCRRDEREAWTRFVHNKEFPTMNEATLRKCSEPPFPDSYRAKEICAKYELRIY